MPTTYNDYNIVGASILLFILYKCMIKSFFPLKDNDWVMKMLKGTKYYSLYIMGFEGLWSGLFLPYSDIIEHKRIEWTQELCVA